MDNRLKQDLDRLLDGDLSEEESLRIQEELEQNPDAIDWLAERAWLHSGLRRSISRQSLQAQILPEATEEETASSSSHWKPNLIGIAACVLALLSLALWLKPESDTSFVTLQETKSALWKSSKLPTSDGSRLGQGTLHLEEGIATLLFDSGAEVTLEAPATLALEDPMNCKLSRGTAVSDIPDSALGFRIKTPSADVVDYGTRFAVSVFEDTGKTHTQVMEGMVQVEPADSDQVVELRTGERNTVSGTHSNTASKEEGLEPQTLAFQAPTHGPEWTLIETQKDAYTGFVRTHESRDLLYLKNAIKEGDLNRMSYLGFNLHAMDREAIQEAELLLYFSPTGWGLASHVPDCEFSVYGLTGTVPDWDESILHNEFPGEPSRIHLGSFAIPQGRQKGLFEITSQALVDFLRSHPNAELTLQVVRDTKEIEGGGLVHGFASHRHPSLPGPSLAIRLREE